MSNQADAFGAADVAAAPDVPLVWMLFTAGSWTANARFNRSGRMESEAIYAVGELAFQAQTGERRKVAARAAVDFAFSSVPRGSPPDDRRSA